MPTVTVLMAVRNGERFLAQAIEGILSQTFSDFELLIVDDGSTDGTADIVTRFRDGRIRYVPAGQRGLPGALNVGLEIASGELIARHDHDDLSHPSRLKCQVDYLTAHPDIALVGTRAWLINESGHRLGRLDRCIDDVSIRWYHLLNNPFVHSSVMFRRHVVWDNFGGYDVSLPLSEDYELWGRVLRRHAAANLPERLLSYRLSAGSKMAAAETAGEQGPFAEIHRDLVRRHIRNMFGDIASEEELRMMGGFVLGVPTEDADRVMGVFWSLAAAYEERFPAAHQSADFRRTVARQVDSVAARLQPFSRRAALRIYRRALVVHPRFTIALPWWRASARLMLGVTGRARLARLRQRARTFSLVA